MSGSLSRAAAALLRWGRGAGGGGLRGPGVRTAGSGGGGGSSAEQLDALVKKDKVVVFLKGTPEQPQCGFSNAVVQILRLHGVRNYAAYNVLDDPQLRQELYEGPEARGTPADAVFLSLTCDAERSQPVTQGTKMTVRSFSGLFFFLLIWKTHRRWPQRDWVPVDRCQHILILA
ncbi:glutaredoxin-related protein 5, mitochondrial isoform X2 [Mirounga angustirostris]|uniref:glutaredoxin-related protein 5, mitochondrial isoform X2 n=1 Tax=Mirounga angustirostris TaxID=9716 RepID=UPI001E68D158|nr:glutaredoxin-related protein 5, mitochondrial isoform X1 [Mirounga angustirostris]